MPKIASVGRALPPFKLSQDDIREFARVQFSGAESGWERLLDVFKNAEISKRYFSVPADWYQRPFGASVAPEARQAFRMPTTICWVTPKERVLIVAIELCGLTFRQNDFSKSNFIATALFGEGAAAVLVTGDEVETAGVEVLDTRSTFWPDSLDVMGWNVMNTGLQVVFSQSIPQIVKERAKDNLEGFLGDHKLTLGDIAHFILHPGGAKVIEAYEAALGLVKGTLAYCRQALRDFGNMSSVSALFVLAEHLKQFSLGSGKYGLISALGPGFCAESLLVRF